MEVDGLDVGVFFMRCYVDIPDMLTPVMHDIDPVKILINGNNANGLAGFIYLEDVTHVNSIY